jgi:RNA polymerase sigma factor (sigma-70 family)
LGPESTLPHIPRLRRYARMLTGDRTRADDLVQDTLERACRKWSLWRPGPSGEGLRGWLLSIMHNQFLNGLRDHAHDRHLTDLDDTNDPAHDPLSLAHLQMDLETALEQLPAPWREVILLVCVEELSYSETAQALGVPQGTVMSRLSRGREQLRHLMQGTPPQTPSAPAPRLKVVK